MSWVLSFSVSMLCLNQRGKNLEDVPIPTFSEEEVRRANLLGKTKLFTTFSGTWYVVSELDAILAQDTNSVPAAMVSPPSPAATEDMSGAGITMLPATEADAKGACAQLNRCPVSSRDEIPIAVEGNEAREDPIVVEDNEVRKIAAECKTEETADCDKSGSTRPPAESLLKALGKPSLVPIVESSLNTLAEPLLDATAKLLLLAESSADSDPDQYESESKSPRGIASALATSW
jgi:hypothetical protein